MRSRQCNLRDAAPDATLVAHVPNPVLQGPRLVTALRYVRSLVASRHPEIPIEREPREATEDDDVPRLYWFFQDDVAHVAGQLGMSALCPVITLDDLKETGRKHAGVCADFKEGRTAALLCINGGTSMAATHWSVILNTSIEQMRAACQDLHLTRSTCPAEDGLAPRAAASCFGSGYFTPLIRSGGDCAAHALYVAFVALRRAGFLPPDASLDRLPDPIFRGEALDITPFEQACRRKPTASMGWKMLTKWAADTSSTGEPFPLQLRSNLAPTASGNCICRGVCSARSPCRGRHVCKFSAALHYDATRKVCTIVKQGPHSAAVAARQVGSEWRAGFTVASEPACMATMPTSADAWSHLQAWAVAPVMSGEPFALTLKSRVHSSCLARGICRARGLCARGDDCPFVAQAVWDACSSSLIIVKTRADMFSQTSRATTPPPRTARDGQSLTRVG